MAFNNAVDANQQGTQYLSMAGAWSGVDASTAGFVLTSNGTGVAPSFQASGTSGSAVQQQFYSDSTMSTSAASIPFDNTIPQITEGVQILSGVFTPTSATNLLDFHVQVTVANNTISASNAMALFQNPTADALATSWSTVSNSGGGEMITIHWQQVSGTVAATTFSVRVGTNAGTMTINGAGAAALFGGTQTVNMSITEIVP